MITDWEVCPKLDELKQTQQQLLIKDNLLKFPLLFTPPMK